MAYIFTLEPELLETELKKLIATESEKEDLLALTDWQNNELLFGENSRIALDSLDALQIAVALQAHFAVRLQGDRMVRKHMMSVADLAKYIREQHQ